MKTNFTFLWIQNTTRICHLLDEFCPTKTNLTQRNKIVYQAKVVNVLVFLETFAQWKMFDGQSNLHRAKFSHKEKKLVRNMPLLRNVLFKFYHANVHFMIYGLGFRVYSSSGKMKYFIGQSETFWHFQFLQWFLQFAKLILTIQPSI